MASNLTQQWFTEKEVAKIIGLSISTLQKDRFYRRGLPYCKVGKAVRYNEADVLAFMESKRISFAPYPV